MLLSRSCTLRFNKAWTSGTMLNHSETHLHLCLASTPLLLQHKTANWTRRRPVTDVKDRIGSKPSSRNVTRACSPEIWAGFLEEYRRKEEEKDHGSPTCL